MVVGIERHVVGVGLRCYEAWVAIASEVEEDVGQSDGDAGGEFVERAHVWPGGWEKEVFAHD